MEELIISKEAIVPWLTELLSSGREVIGVKKHLQRYRLEKLDTADEAVLDYDVTTQSPKKFIFPAREDLITFTGIEGRMPATEKKDRIIFGVHPYDIHAISVLDDVFKDGQQDPYYLQQRARTIIVGVDVLRPSLNAFCSSMGTATVQDGFDLMLTPIEGAYFIRVGSDRGKKILPKKTTKIPSDTQRAQFYKEQDKAQVRFALNKVETSVNELPALLEKNQHHPVWEELEKRCLGCGSCNLVCPTCYCFDVKDEMELDLSGGVRYRTWDGCLLKDFTRVASGETFRESRANRNRHRFFRKGKYMIEKYNKPGCVGCGRCTTHCLADINPVEVFNALAQKEVQ
jgi:ferredoxin